MNKRVNNAKGKPSKNQHLTKKKLNLDIRKALALRQIADMEKAEIARQARQEKVKPQTKPRGFRPRIREFFNRRRSSQGARNR